MNGMQTGEQPKVENIDNEELAGLKAQAESMEEKPVSKAEVEAVEEQAKSEESAAVATASGAMAVVTMVLKVLFPYLEIDPKQTEEVAESLAPVFKKYGLHLGGQWQEEMTAVSAVGMFGFVIYSQIKAHQVEEAEKKKAVENGA